MRRSVKRELVLALAEPAQRNGPPLVWVELQAALLTLREAFVGFLIGGGRTLNVYGFRKNPYASRHAFRAAISTGAHL